MWICNRIAVFVRELWEHGMLVLAYVDDFLIALSPHGTKSTSGHCQHA